MSTPSQGAGSIAEFLISLVDRAPEWRDADSARRREMMEEAGLTTAQQEIIESGDLTLIRSYIDYEYGAGLAPSLKDSPDEGPSAGSGATMVVTWMRPPPTYQPPPPGPPPPTY